MTRVDKITVSLPYELAEKARRGVREGVAASVSAYVAVAIAEKAEAEDLKRMLDEILAETGGPATVAELDAADRELGRSAKAASGERAGPAGAKKKAKRKR